MGAWYRLVLGMLATWRLTHLIHVEDGPWKIIARFRGALARTDMLRQLVDCFYCLSMWVAAPLAYFLGDTWTERTLLLPALSAAAILLERVTQPAMPVFTEDPEESDGLLWKKPNEHRSDEDRRSDP